MKSRNLVLLLSVFILNILLLTACGNNTFYISDQTGKEIPITSSNSDTYTFKLPSAETEEIEASTVTVPEEAETTTIKESEDPILEAPLVEEGPKTGEP